jgi:hypothetical protein
MQFVHNMLKLTVELLVQRCGFSLEPSHGTSIEATFTPDGKYVVAGIIFLFIFYKLAL